jgi:hypothetical protein
MALHITVGSVTCNAPAVQPIKNEAVDRAFDGATIVSFVRRQIALRYQDVHFRFPEFHFIATNTMTAAAPIRPHPLGGRLSLVGRLDRLGSYHNSLCTSRHHDLFARRAAVSLDAFSPGDTARRQYTRCCVRFFLHHLSRRHFSSTISRRITRSN